MKSKRRWLWLQLHCTPRACRFIPFPVIIKPNLTVLFLPALRHPINFAGTGRYPCSDLLVTWTVQEVSRPNDKIATFFKHNTRENVAECLPRGRLGSELQCAIFCEQPFLHSTSKWRRPTRHPQQSEVGGEGETNSVECEEVKGKKAYYLRLWLISILHNPCSGFWLPDAWTSHGRRSNCTRNNITLLTIASTVAHSRCHHSILGWRSTIIQSTAAQEKKVRASTQSSQPKHPSTQGCEKRGVGGRKQARVHSNPNFDVHFRCRKLQKTKKKQKRTNEV